MEKTNKNPDERIRARRDLEDTLKETPTQSLAEVRAEAVESAVGRCAWYADRVWMKIDDLKDYAQQIREGSP